MANKNVISVDLIFNEKGKLKGISQTADKTTKSINKLTQATERAAASTKKHAKGRDAWNRQAKGTAQITSNSTKAFSKQAQSIGGTLVPAYATLAANIFALTAAFGALQRAAAFEQLKQGLIEVGSAAGTNLGYVAKGLKEITGAAVSAQAAMSAVALGTSAGFSSEQLKELTTVARGASLALGRNLEDALTRLVKGTAKLEPEILDELGIMVRLDDAVEKYAASIGKSAASLTQFERRQAFLNETLTQGLEKFQEVSDAVDTNPYDQLASSFNDLQKASFKWLNLGLVPIVNILSSSPTALMGVLILFSSTITKAIIPGLDASINKQRVLGAMALRDAKLAKVEQSKRLAAQTSAIAAKSLPKKAAAEFAKATLSAKGYKIALDSLDASEKSRTNWIKRWKGQLVELSAQKRALIAQIKVTTGLQREALIASLAETRAAQVATNAKIVGSQIKQRETAKEILMIKALEKEELNLASIQRATAASMMAGRQAYLLNQIQSAGAVKGFGIAIGGAAQQWKRAKFGLIPTTLGKIGLGFKLAAGSASLFGRALLTAIPAIGTIILALGILAPMISSLFKGSEVNQAVDEVVESFDSFNGIIAKVNSNMYKGVAASTAYAKALRASVGIVNQVKDGFIRLAKEQQKASTEDMNKLIDKEAAARIRLNMAQKRYNASIMEENKIRNANDVLKYTEEVRNAAAAVRELQKETSTIDKTEGLRIITTAIAKLEAGGGGKIFGATVEGFKTLRESLEGGPVNAAGFIDMLNGIFQQAESASASIESAKATVSSFDKVLNKLANKPTTVFDNLVDQAKTVRDEIAQAGADDPKGITEFIRRTGTLEKKLLSILGLVKGTTLTPEQITEGMELLVDTVVKAQDELLNLKARIKTTTDELRMFKTISAADPNAMRGQIQAQLQILSIRKQAIDKQIKALHIVKNAEAIARLQADKSALQAESNLIMAKRHETIEVSRLKGAKRLFDLEAKTLGFRKATLEATRAINQANLKLLSDKSRLDVSPQDQLKLFQAEKAARIDMSEKMLKSRIQGINLEYDLLAAQTKLQRITAATMGIAPDAYDALLRQMEAARTAAITSAKTAQKGELAAITGSEAALIRSVLDAMDENKDRLRSVMAAEFSTAGAINLELATKHRQLLIDEERLQKAIDEGKSNSLDTSRTQVELDEKRLEILKSRLGMMEQAAARASRLAGGGAGIAVQAGADTAARRDIINNQVTDENGEAVDTNFSDRIQATEQIMNPMIETLKSLSPEGEVMAAVTAGAFAMSEAFTIAFEQIRDNGLNSTEGIMAGLQAAGSAVSALGSVMAASSRATIAGIDAQIDAEKRRDGKSAQSVAKLNALEKKKEKEKRKAFEQDKKMKMAMTVINTATAVMAVFAEGGIAGFVLAGIVAAIGAMQLAAIAGTSYQGGASSGGGGGPSSVAVGERSNTVDLAKSTSPSGELAFMRGAQGTGDTGATNFVPTPGRAAGGNVAFPVGEQGPELFVPDRPGVIIPAGDSEGAAAGAPLNVSFQISAIDSQGMEDALIRQRGNIIKMIREAANDRGEFFLESVNTYEDESRL